MVLTLNLLEEVRRKLAAIGLDVEFRVISNQPPALSLHSLVLIPCRKDTKIADLLTFYVGLMPLVDDPWARGKRALKALYYMALGIPALVSPVGMNTEVVIDGQNGFVCATPDQWYTALQTSAGATRFAG